MADLSKQPLFLQSMFLIFISCTSILQFSASGDVGFAFGEVLQTRCSLSHTYERWAICHGSFAGM